MCRQQDNLHNRVKLRMPGHGWTAQLQTSLSMDLRDLVSLAWGNHGMVVVQSIWLRERAC